MNMIMNMYTQTLLRCLHQCIPLGLMAAFLRVPEAPAGFLLHFVHPCVYLCVSFGVVVVLRRLFVSPAPIPVQPVPRPLLPRSPGEICTPTLGF